MFLSELRPKQKELFLDLGIILSESDGKFDVSEKKVISEMCREMDIVERTKCDRELSEILDEIKSTAYSREKRIILLETAGIVLADGIFSGEEENLIKRISEFLEINYVQYQEMLKIVQELYGIYTKIGDFLSSK